MAKQQVQVPAIAIDELLWFGDSPDQRAARSFAMAVGRVHGLRPFPPAVQRLLDAIGGDDFSVEHVTRIVESDPSLASGVLRIVNSAGFALLQRCSSLRHAVTLLGASTLCEMATGMTLLDRFGAGSRPAAQLAAHSTATAAIARQLGAITKIGLADELYLSGLLHDVGKLLLLQVTDDVVGEGPYARALELAFGHIDAVHGGERAELGFDHGVLGGHLLREWRFADPIPQIVAWHHQPERAWAAGGSIATLVAAVRLANRCAYELDRQVELDEPTLAELTASSECIHLGLAREQWLEIWPELRAAVEPAPPSGRAGA